MENPNALSFSWIPSPIDPNLDPCLSGTWSNSPKSCPSCSNAPLPLLARQAQRSQMRAFSMPRSGREPPKGKSKRYKIRLYEGAIDGCTPRKFKIPPQKN